MRTMGITETKDGVIIGIRVRPNAKEFRLIVEADSIVLFSTEEPTRGRVNKQVLKELTRLFHRRVELLSGFSSKDKKLLIRDAKKEEVEHILHGF